MDHCPNCGSEVAPTALVCPACRLPRPRGLSDAVSGQGVGPHGLFRPDQQEGPFSQGGAPSPSPWPTDPDRTHVPTRAGLAEDGPTDDRPTDASARASERSGERAGADRGQAVPPPGSYRGEPTVPRVPSPTRPLAAAWVTEPIHPDSGQQPPPRPPAPPAAGGSPFNDPAESGRRRQRRTVIGIVAAALAVAVLLGVGVAVAINAAGGRVAQPSPPTDASVPPPTSSGSRVPTPDPTPSPTPTSGSSSTQPDEPTPSGSGTTGSSESPSATEGPGALPGDSTTCEEGRVAVPEKGTSCAFAREVANAVSASPPAQRSFTVTARSPVTKKKYTMSCTRDGRLVTCTGGTGAIVYVLEKS